MIETLNTPNFPPRLGGHICLDFTNTAERRHSDGFRDCLRSYHDLLAWCYRTDVITETQADRSYAAAQEYPDHADEAFQYAMTVRETLYEVFATLAARHILQSSDVIPLNTILAGLLPYRRLEAGRDTCVWGWEADERHLERIVLPIVMAAADLLTSEQVKQARQCPECGYLFLDTSRNHSRRWCSMDYCGSKIKSRRQYERKRSLARG